MIEYMTEKLFDIFNLPFFAFQKGATAILLAVLMLSVMLVIGLGVSALITNQLGMSVDAGQSVLSFYAADAGAEACLYQTRHSQNPCANVGGSLSGSLTNGANFTAQRTNNKTIRSTGFFGKTSRRVELTW